MPASTDVVPLFLRVPRHEIAYVKFVFESYEGVAVVRTVDRHEAVLVVLAVPDMESQARTIIAALQAEGACAPIDPPRTDLDLLGPDDS